MINWEALSAIANIAMALVSIIGLWFIYGQLATLSSQEDQQNRELKLGHYSDYTKRYQEILIQFPSNIGSSSFELGKLKTAERERVLVYMRAYFDLCYEEWDLHKRKLIEDSSWEVWNDGMSKTLRRPAFRDAWQYFANSDSEFGSEFSSFIAKIQY